jgi:hypothetical protein
MVSKLLLDVTYLAIKGKTEIEKMKKKHRRKRRKPVRDKNNFLA